MCLRNSTNTILKEAIPVIDPDVDMIQLQEASNLLVLREVWCAGCLRNLRNRPPLRHVHRHEDTCNKNGTIAGTSYLARIGDRPHDKFTLEKFH